jgi:hypothetical protein
MIPFAELPTTDGVYVIHFSAPLAHAHGYVGWSADIARRVADPWRCATSGSAPRSRCSTATCRTWSPRLHPRC